MKTVTEVIGVSRSNLIERMRERAKKRIGRPPLSDDNLVAEIKAVIAELRERQRESMGDAAHRRAVSPTRQAKSIGQHLA